MTASWSWRLTLATLLAWVATLPVHAEPPEAERDAPAAPIAIPDEFKQLLQGAEAWNQLPPAARQIAVEKFRSQLPQIQENVEKSLYQRAKDKRSEAWGPINEIILLLICAGPLLLLMPLVLVWRYPGRLLTLILYSALSAVLFSLTVALFYVPLWAFSEIWEEIAIGMDPRLQTVHATFQLMDKNADSFLSRDLPIAETLEELDDGSLESFITILLNNLAEIEQQVEVFAPLVNLYRKLDWVFGSLPKLQCLIFTVLFVIPLYPVFRAIVLLPAHAAAGSEKEGMRVVTQTLRNWWREVCALLCLMALCLVALISSDTILSMVAEPTTETMLTFLFVALDYLGHAETPYLPLLYFALAAVGLYHVFVMAVTTIALVLYLSLAHRVFRLKFHEGVPLRDHRRFWGWGTAAMAWAQLLPLLFIYLSGPVVHAVFYSFVDAAPPEFLGGMVTGGALLFFGLVFVFWLARGFKALMFLLRYKIPVAHVAVH